MDKSDTIIGILENHHIEYWTEGKNVSENSINIQCPFCNDHSNHCGIFKESLLYHCWKCGSSGSFTYLVAYICHVTMESVEDEVDSGVTFTGGQDSESLIKSLWNDEDDEDEGETVAESVSLPSEWELVTPSLYFPLLDQYLQVRGYTRETLQYYGCGVCRVGPFMNRMVVPIYYNQELVSWQAAALTRGAQVKYHTARGKVNQYLYPWDKLYFTDKRYVVLVEGVLDAWRVGGNTLSTFGTSLTDRQKFLLSSLDLDSLVFCWDGDAWEHAYREAEDLQIFIPDVSVVRLPMSEDPDSYGHHQTRSLIEETVGQSLF